MKGYDLSQLRDRGLFPILAFSRSNSSVSWLFVLAKGTLAEGLGWVGVNRESRIDEND
jgi:hypothetical protein